MKNKNESAKASWGKTYWQRHTAKSLRWEWVQNKEEAGVAGTEQEWHEFGKNIRKEDQKKKERTLGARSYHTIQIIRSSSSRSQELVG